MGGFAAPPLTRLARLAPGLRAAARTQGEHASVPASFGEPACMAPFGAPGALRGPHPARLSLAAQTPLRDFCGVLAVRAPLSPGSGPALPSLGSFGRRLPGQARHRCAGEPVPRLAALPIGHAARPSLGARRPPAPLAAPGRCGSRAARAPAPSGARCGCALALLRPLCGRACLAAGLLPPWPPVPGRAAPPAPGLFPSLLPPLGRPAAGGGHRPPFYGFRRRPRCGAGVFRCGGDGGLQSNNCTKGDSFMLKVVVLVNAPVEDATGVKELICMELEKFGEARVLSVEPHAQNPLSLR